MIDTSKMAFPVVALGKCAVGKAEYLPGDVFDAATKEVQDALLKAKVIRPMRLGEHVGRSIPVDAAKAELEKTAETVPSTMEILERLGAGKGTHERAAESTPRRRVRR